MKGTTNLSYLIGSGSNSLRYYHLRKSFNNRKYVELGCQLGWHEKGQMKRSDMKVKSV